MNNYPFPDKTTCIEELKHDINYHKICKEDILGIVDKAWNTGKRTAELVFSKYYNMDIYEIMKLKKIKIEHRNVDKISANDRYFSEYYSGQNTVYLYELSIKKWSDINNISYNDAIKLVLAHELYHYFEMNTIGKTSEQYKVPRIKIGALSIGQTGIRALSEIGAHGFAYTWYVEKINKGN